MKKIVLILLVAAFSGCDDLGIYDAYSYYVWVNESDHQITLTGASDVGRYEFKDEVLQPGERLEKEMLAPVPPPAPVQYVSVMKILFDDRVEVIYDYFAPPGNLDIRYDPFVDENYVQEDVARPNGCKKCRGRRWTYTFTNADYDAAVAYIQAQEE